MGECKTLWMGDIQANWEEFYVRSLFSSFGQEPNVKLIRDKGTGCPVGYGFIEFDTVEAAQTALETLNGQFIPNTPIRFRLNWGAGGKRLESAEDYSIFVGDLAPEVTDDALFAVFSAKYASVRGAKVVLDQMTRTSKGFGFVRFGVKAEADQALEQMHGVPCLSRPMRVSPATDRIKPTPLVKLPPSPSPEDESNTTVFVGGLDPSINEDDLRKHFSTLGEIVNVKVPPGRGCGFVQYESHAIAQQAIQEMTGMRTQIGQSRLRCAWGRPTPTGNRVQPLMGYPYPPSALPPYGYTPMQVPYQFYPGPYAVYGYQYAGYPMTYPPMYPTPYTSMAMVDDESNQTSNQQENPIEGNQM